MKIQIRLLTVLIIVLNMVNAQWQKSTETIQHPKKDNYTIDDMKNHKKEKAMIDWSKGWVEFEGEAYVNETMAGNWGKALTRAERTARIIAISDMADFVMDLMVKGTSEYEFEELKVDEFSTAIGGEIKDRHYVIYKDKGMTEIVVPGRGREPYAWGKYVIGMQMYSDRPGEGIISSILPNERQGYKNDGFTVYQPKALPVTGERQVKSEVVTQEKYTGLVIDARGLNLMSSMSPAIFVEGVNKQQLYGALTVMTSAAEKFGIVSYLTDLNEAKTVSRVMQHGMTNPLLVKATRATGRKNQSVFVSKDDAATIFSSNNETNFLDECRVVFVVD